MPIRSGNPVANTFAALVGAVVCVVAAGTLSGCEEDEFFRDCPLSASILEECETNAPNTALTCVVREHPMCDEQVCATWEDSVPFCSRPCAQNTECPAGSACEEHTGFSFCVPDFARGAISQ